MRATFALSLSLLLLPGCATLPPVDLSLVNVAFTDATVLETSATFVLRIDNPETKSLWIEGSSHRIYVNGQFVGTGLSDQAVELPRLSSLTLPVRVHLSNLRLATRVRPMIESRRFDYRIDSTLHTRAPGRRLRVQSEGRLDLNEFQSLPHAPMIAPLAP